MDGYDQLLARVTAPPARRAFEMLHTEAVRYGFSIRYKVSGKVHSVDLRIDGSHQFSWIPNRAHLLFYIRDKAIAADAGLVGLARSYFRSDTKRNERGEVTIRIADPVAAATLAGWLFPAFGTEPASPSNGEGPPLQLTLSDDADFVATTFRAWGETLVGAAEQLAPHRYWLPEQGIALAERPELNLTFATAPDGHDNAVHINVPQTAGSENPLSGIGIATDGTRYVLRQAWLQPNDVSPDAIRDEVFAERTGLAPVQVLVGIRPSRRIWHVVARLDGVTPDDICAQTADFVGRCWSARLWSSDVREETERLVELFGTDERGGRSGYALPGQERIMRRRHGDVWLALRAALAGHGIRMDKPRHFAGYEVDAVVHAPAGRLLVEIKTGTNAADIYTGVGQLMMYQQLLPHLRGLPRVLLLPAEPRPALFAAAGSSGIEVHSYLFDGEERVSFAPRFLRRCGCAVREISSGQVHSR